MGLNNTCSRGPRLALIPRGLRLEQRITKAEYTSLISLTPSSPLVPVQLAPNCLYDSHHSASKASKLICRLWQIYIDKAWETSRHMSSGCVFKNPLLLWLCFFFFLWAVNITSSECSWKGKTYFVFSSGAFADVASKNMQKQYESKQKSSMSVMWGAQRVVECWKRLKEGRCRGHVKHKIESGLQCGVKRYSPNSTTVEQAIQEILFSSKEKCMHLNPNVATLPFIMT